MNIVKPPIGSRISDFPHPYLPSSEPPSPEIPNPLESLLLLEKPLLVQIRTLLLDD